MKLLFLCERVDDEGGTETYLRTLIPALTARGHDVRIVARSVKNGAAFGTPARAVQWSDEHDAPSVAAGADVTRIARDFQPDAVLAQNVLDRAVLEAAYAHARASIYVVHDHRPFCPNGDRLYPQGGGVCGVRMGSACLWHSLVHGCAYGPRSKTRELLRIRADVAASIRKAQAVIALSHFVADLAALNGVARERLHVVAPPLADDAYSSSIQGRPERDSVLFAGRVMPSKGTRSLVRAVGLLPEKQRLQVRIAGTGPDLEATLSEARDLRVDAVSLGHLDAPALRAAYDDATIVAVPSLWAEPFGLVGIEAFARGRPVVAFNSGGIVEWIEQGGIGVPRGDERAMGAAIATLCEKAAWDITSRKAFSAAQRYRCEEHVEAIERIIAM